jgi:hypothetical protein
MQAACRSIRTQNFQVNPASSLDVHAIKRGVLKFLSQRSAHDKDQARASQKAVSAQ